MDKYQLESLAKYLPTVFDRLDSTTRSFAVHLESKRIVTFDDRLLIDNEKTNRAKLLALLSLLKWKDLGWNVLISYLKENRQAALADRLMFTAGKLAIPFDETKMYRNFSSPKGLALIINNEDFDGARKVGHKLTDRLGTVADVEKCRQIWEDLGYKVEISVNLSAHQMVEEMEKFRLSPYHKDADSSVLIVLSHGSRGNIYGVDGQRVKVDQMISRINDVNCPALINKPKLILMQISSGENNERLGTDTSDFYKVPLMADCLMCISTSSGYVTWRNHTEGSWFIQTIFDIFKEFCYKKHLVEILTMANSKFALGYGSDQDHLKMPQITNSLTKDFYIFPPDPQ